MSTIVVTVLLIYIPFTTECNLSCGSSCCESSYCCEISSTCQSCRKTCSTACRSQSCEYNCHQNCYHRNDCNQDCHNRTCNPNTFSSTSTTTYPRPYPRPYPYPVTPAPSVYKVNNTGNSSFETTLNLKNIVSIINNFSIPISVNNENNVDVKISLKSETNEETVNKTNEIVIDKTTTTWKPMPTLPTPKPEPMPYPVPIPVPNIPIPRRVVYIPVPRPILVPMAQPGCCNIINSCLSGGNCQRFSSQCGSQCTSNNMYAPSNPCSTGCIRRQFGISYNCFSSGYCQQKLTDCDMCSDNFYMNFDNYRRCAGCFSVQ